MNNNPKPPIPLFKTFCGNLGAFPTAFSDSMTVYECLAWLYKYLDKFITPTLNTTVEGLAELKYYVEHYFDNLDVQEEINNKLDAMVEDGTLAEIINQEIFNELNGKVDQNTADIDALENKLDFANLKVTQDLIYQPVGQSGNNFQGAVVDDNNIMYVYNENNFPNGDLLRFNIVSHEYVDSISNLNFFHGNSLTLLNGDMYVAPYKNSDGEANNKTMIKYTLATGSATTISSFTSEVYDAVFGVAQYDNKIIAALKAGADYTPSSNKYVLFDPTTQTSQTFTVNRNNIWMDDCQDQDIEVINNKLYLLTSPKNMIYEFEIDSTALTLNLNKVYDLGLKDELGLDFCEFQALSRVRSGDFGEDSFIVNAVDFDNEAAPVLSLKSYLGRLNSNVNPFLPPITTNFNTQKRIDIYVTRAGGSNLLENGSSTYPFKSINRAINFANNSGHVAVRDILITDNSDYWVGKQTNKTLSITWSSNAPTIHMDELVNCDVHIDGVGNSTTLAKIGDEYIRFKTCRGIVKNFITSDRIRVDTGSTMVFSNFNQTVTVSENFYVDRSIVNLNPTNMTGGTSRILEVDNGSSVQIPSAYSAIEKRARNGSNITVASS